MGLPTGIGTMNKVSNLVFKEVMGIAVYRVEKSKLASWAFLVGIDLRLLVSFLLSKRHLHQYSYIYLGSIL